MANPADKERIALTLPPNAAYVTSARLTAASIANRVGFDVDEIEDIKTAVSEACIFAIRKLENHPEPFKIEFVIDDARQGANIEIVLTSAAKADFAVTGQDLGVLMIKALMDTFEAKTDKGLTLRLTKSHKKVSFD